MDNDRWSNIVDKSEEDKRRRLQRDEGGNEDPGAMAPKEVKEKEEGDYYEEGNGGATD